MTTGRINQVTATSTYASPTGVARQSVGDHEADG